MMVKNYGGFRLEPQLWVTLFLTIIRVNNSLVFILALVGFFMICLVFGVSRFT